MYLDGEKHIAWEAVPRLVNGRSTGWDLPYGSEVAGDDLVWVIRYDRGYPHGTMFLYHDGEDFAHAREVPYDELKEIYAT